MHSSMLRTDADILATCQSALDGPPALEVQAAYKGVVIDTRLLSDIERKRRLRPVRGLDPRTRYTIGESPSADAPASSALLGTREMPLVTRWSGGFLVSTSPHMTGNVAVAGRVYRLADYLAGRGANFTLPDSGCAQIHCGDMCFQLSHTRAARPLPRRWLAWKWDEQKFTLGSLLSLGLFLLMIFAVPPQGMSLSSDALDMSRIFVPFTINATKSDELPDFMKPNAEKGKGEAGKAQAGDSGKMGNPKSQNASGAYAVKKNGEKPHLGQAEAAKLAQNAGILGVLNQTAASRFSSIFGYGTAAGEAEKDVLGNLVAANIGEGWGTHGFGVTGTGNSGGGTGLTSLGIGNFNTLGGSGYGHERGVGNLSPKKRVAIRNVIPGSVTTRGALDKEIIRRIVRAHMNEVKYCYDQELVRNRNLAGRISLQFVISGTGQVISSFVQSTTMNNVRVEGCVANAVKRWSFPKPTGAGIAIVSYPFNFVAGMGN